MRKLSWLFYPPPQHRRVGDRLPPPSEIAAPSADRTFTKVRSWPGLSVRDAGRQLPLSNLAITPKDCCRASSRTHRPGHQRVLVTVRFKHPGLRISASDDERRRGHHAVGATTGQCGALSRARRGSAMKVKMRCIFAALASSATTAVASVRALVDDRRRRAVRRRWSEASRRGSPHERRQERKSMDRRHSM